MIQAVSILGERYHYGYAHYWPKLWPDMAAMQNKDNAGFAHYPGWSMELLLRFFIPSLRMNT
jgi:hypothetical protein